MLPMLRSTLLLAACCASVSFAFQFPNRPAAQVTKLDIRQEGDNDASAEGSPEGVFGAAYSGLTNAWGYSRALVTQRQRRRYERRRILHIAKLNSQLKGKRPPSFLEEIGIVDKYGAADSFIGNVKRSSKAEEGEIEGADGPSLNDIDEDGYWEMLGQKRRGFLSSIIRKVARIPYRFLYGEYKRVEPGTLILVRHGESVWNANKTFTGWANPDLSSQGYREVEHAARLLLEGGYDIDIVFTSRLTRAIRSAWIILREFDQVYLPVFKSWRLNERNYGALTGLSKTETAERLGAELVQEWRGSLRSRPPALNPADKYYPGRDRRHADLSPEQIPLTESLLDCMERTKPVWRDKISYELACGKNVLVVAHANTLRGLVKIIDGIGDDEIQDIAIPTGIPIVYNFDNDLKPIPPAKESVVQVHMNGRFLEKPGLLKEAIKREQEWCRQVPDYDKVMKAQSGLTPLQRSLTKLEASREVQSWAEQFIVENTDEDDGSDGKLTMARSEDEIWENGLNEIEEGEYFDPDHVSARSKKWTDLLSARQFEDDLEAEAQELFAPIYSPPCVTALPPTTSIPGIGPTPPKKEPALIVMIRHGKTENNKLGLFTGWDDVPLAKEGIEEAKDAGRLLKTHGFEFDVVYTSWLSRAIETAWLVMDEMDCLWLPIIKTWRLNERMYGRLTSLSKSMVRQKYGEEQFKAWRRGYSVKPPRVSSFSPQYPGNDVRYNKYMTDVRISLSETLIRSIESGKLSPSRKLPKSESLKNCMERTIPFFTDQIIPEAIADGKRVLIASSENAIRGLLMHLCEIPEEKINGLEIPNGLPLIFDMNSKCVKLLDDGTTDDPLEKYNFGTSASYLFKPCIDDEGCGFTFDAEGIELSESDQSLIDSIKTPTTAA